MIDTPEWPTKNFTFFGQGCKLIGTFHLSGIVKISSHMEGELHILANGGMLTIERPGKFKGIIHCEDIEIFGEVQGQIISSGKVILQSSAQIDGKIESKNLCIYPGASANIEGHTQA